MTEDEMAGWHHQFNGHELEQTPGDGEAQGALACYSPWGCKGWDTTEQHHIQPRRAEATAETHMCLVPVLNNHTMATIM